MAETRNHGWQILLAGYPWFRAEGSFPLPAYSEFMPPPRLGRKPLGKIDPLLVSEEDSCAWPISEIEEEYELKPGLNRLASQILSELTSLGRGQQAHLIAGHRSQNLEGNPYWPPELAEHAGRLEHERYIVLLPLALARTQDDMGRVRWTLFGSSEQGPEQAFWKGFYSAPGQEWTAERSCSFLLQLLQKACGLAIDGPAGLEKSGFRIAPSDAYPERSLPAWTKPFLLDEHTPLENVHYLLTFRPFAALPASIRQRYFTGKLILLPFPGSLVFWGMPTCMRLQQDLPTAAQIPVLRLAARHGGPYGLRVPQSGWLHEPHPQVSPDEVERHLIRDTYARTHRWSRIHRYEDELALNPRVDKLARVLFDASPEVLGLYGKPMARNCQIWTRDFRLLLDGPKASREEIRAAEAAIIEGGLFGYRFCFPAMRVGRHEVYWHRPLVAFAPPNGDAEVLWDAPLGYMTAYPADHLNLDQAVELWPRLLQRDLVLSALREFECKHDHYQHQTALNILGLLHCHAISGGRLQKSLARHLLRTAREQSLEEWLASLPERACQSANGRRLKQEIESRLDPEDEDLPEPITYGSTATRSFETAWWQDISVLSRGRFLNKDNADCVLDPATRGALAHHQRDLERLGDYLLTRHRAAIAEADMEGKAVCGELPFRWQTDFDFPHFGGWRGNQDGSSYERNLLTIIPGRDRTEAFVMADHYDTAYMEDVYEASQGGSGARLASAGADDNHSATATLLQAAPLFLRLAREGQLERDVWLLHLTGEEFPSDCMGARQFCQSLVEGTLRLRLENQWLDLSSVRVAGVLVMDMIAHNRDDARDIFQIAPGRSLDSLHIAEQAHLANKMWNFHTTEWNQRPERQGRQRGRRAEDGATIPELALHPNLHGDVRLPYQPHSTLYNTDGQIFSDVGIPVALIMENYDINRSGYHDTHDTLQNIDLDYGCALAAIAIETVAMIATRPRSIQSESAAARNH